MDEDARGHSFRGILVQRFAEVDPIGGTTGAGFLIGSLAVPSPVIKPRVLASAAVVAVGMWATR